MAKVECSFCNGLGWECNDAGREDCRGCSGMGFTGSDDVDEESSDGDGQVTFNAEEMVFLKAIFAGECHVSRLTEGGDYMRCFVKTWNEYDLERFMNKITGEW